MRYARGKFLQMIPLIFITTFVTRGSLALLGRGTPLVLADGTKVDQAIVTILGPSAMQDPKRVHQAINEFGFDRPLPIQYLRWAGRALTGNFGTSYSSREQVTGKLLGWAPLSLQLVVMSIGLALLISIPLGVWAAYREGGMLDRVVSNGSLLGLSFPAYVLGIFLIFFVAIPTKWFPVGGYVRFTENPFESVRSLFLPALTLAIGQSANYLRILRTDMLTTLQEDFILLAKAKGVSDNKILFGHALRPSSFTLLTVAAINFGALIGGTIFIERTYNLSGMGLGLLTAIYARDYSMIMGGVAVITTAFVLVTTLVDLLYGVLDPRVRAARSLA